MIYSARRIARGFNSTREGARLEATSVGASPRNPEVGVRPPVVHRREEEETMRASTKKKKKNATVVRVVAMHERLVRQHHHHDPIDSPRYHRHHMGRMDLVDTLRHHQHPMHS